MLKELINDLEKLKNPEQARILQGFFKTGKGEYGEGDIFLGIKSQPLKEIAKKYNDISDKSLQILLNSKIHDYRIIAMRILVYRFEHLNEKEKNFQFYINNLDNINNWDLVDLSAPNIVGNYLIDKDKSILYKLAKSNKLWDKRVSIIATYAFIKNNQYEDTLKISEILLNDKHDLIHKAVGWMLREIGKRNLKIEESFLKKHYRQMPRTMLRYAIEKFPKDKKEFYMKK
ncbi:DNA alkylation repair protein [Candidatus Woesearchaeota archaeon]|nr:DNA alkylation repair protein [Candidatus Woesearchaeota archaeon]